MDESVAIINKLIVDVFDDILKLEENALRSGMFSDVSLTEVHTIEAIGMYSKLTASEVARKLKITAGTLTVAVNNLVKKNYVNRLRCEDDRRVVKLGLTGKGRVLFRVHEKFHEDMVRQSITGLDREEERVLLCALSSLHQFLAEKLSAMESKLKPVSN
ncbi:MAG: MarR family transcriptional regulator [Clostridiales bacterium]|nr:MarR family transcriptional regulator [Clostridiales bacterium]